MDMKKLLTLAIILVSATAYCAPGQGTVNVTTSETAVFPASTYRTWATISNTGATGCSLKINSGATPATAGQGTYLAPGAFITLFSNGYSNPARNAVTAITATGSTTLSFEYDDVK